MFRGFQYHGIAGGQCRGEFPDQRSDRGIPGQNHANDAERFPFQVVVHVRDFCRNQSALELVAHAGVIMEGVHQPATGFQGGDDLTGQFSIVPGFHLTQTMGMGRNHIADTAQHPSALGWHHGSPRPLAERSPGGRHGLVDIIGAAVRHPGPDFTRGRILTVEPLA